MLVVWAVFFIARRRDTTPKLKARNFTKAIQRGLPRGKRPMAKESPSPLPGAASRSEGGGAEQRNGYITNGRPI